MIHTQQKDNKIVPDAKTDQLEVGIIFATHHS